MYRKSLMLLQKRVAIDLCQCRNELLLPFVVVEDNYYCKRKLLQKLVAYVV
jgi:hypothetical protein